MTVTLPYDPVWRPLEWAKKHCPSYITNEAGPINEASIVYYFGDERDAMWFILRWSS
jgi:hypothetical protein